MLRPTPATPSTNASIDTNQVPRVQPATANDNTNAGTTSASAERSSAASERMMSSQTQSTDQSQQSNASVLARLSEIICCMLSVCVTWEIFVVSCKSPMPSCLYPRIHIYYCDCDWMCFCVCISRTHIRELMARAAERRIAARRADMVQAVRECILRYA